MNYFNTTGSNGADLKDYEMVASRQEVAILGIFLQHPTTRMMPSTIHRLLATKAPLTSTRRGMTNLTAHGVLEKTAHQRPGPLGRPEHCWRLRRQEGIRNKPMCLPFDGATA